MFTRKPGLLLAVAVLVAVSGLSGCNRKPDPQQYGEIITEVPQRLNKPFPLPELDEPEGPAEETSK